MSRRVQQNKRRKVEHVYDSSNDNDHSRDDEVVQTPPYTQSLRPARFYKGSKLPRSMNCTHCGNFKVVAEYAPAFCKECNGGVDPLMGWSQLYRLELDTTNKVRAMNKVSEYNEYVNKEYAKHLEEADTARARRVYWQAKNAERRRESPMSEAARAGWSDDLREIESRIANYSIEETKSSDDEDEVEL